MIRFLFNNQIITLSQKRADLTVLEYLREEQGVKSSKEGCASGDCGACTVVVVELNQQTSELSYKAINSCITFLGAIDGKQLITADQLPEKGKLHPVQQAMVDLHGAQCGFCTPGFIMSMFALYHQDKPSNRDDVVYALSGNLCRCTGYRPIIDAALRSCNDQTMDKFSNNAAQTVTTLKKMANESLNEPSFTDVLTHENIALPKSRSELKQAKQAWSEAKIVAGSTDLALEYTQLLKPLTKLISLAKLEELKQINVSEQHLSIGAGCSLSQITPFIEKYFPDLNELFERFASLPIRNQATIGGNVANASPIGDLPPVLIALQADIIADNGTSKRTIEASDFFLDYKKTDLHKDEWLSEIQIPMLQDNQCLRAYKVSKRFEDDISAVCAVFKITIEQDKVTALSTGFGGVAAIPIACNELHTTLLGTNWQDSQCVQTGKVILSGAFTPLDDVRASAEYRSSILANLWHRFWLETSAQQQQIATRVTTHA